MKELREYQKQAIEAVNGDLQTEGRALLVLPTGSGKSLVAAHVIDGYVKRRQRVLTIAHREELIAQAVSVIREVTHLSPMDVQVEMASHAAGPAARVVCGSVATMRGKRLARWERDHFGLNWVDEVHHLPSPTYMALTEHFSAHLFGCTATPDRLDKKSLGRFFSKPSYVYELIDAIRDGFLCPIKVRMVMIPSFSLATVRSRMGDFVESDLGRELCREPSLYEVVKPTVDLAGDRPTLVFAVNIAHGQALTRVFNEYKAGSADFLCGTDTSERRRGVVEDLRRGRIKRLVSVGLFTEGVDLPFISCVAMARPTQSRALYSQAIGRGTRIAPGKSDCLVLDFTDNATSHSLVCALDILDDNADGEVKKRAVLAALDHEVEPIEEMNTISRDIAEEERARAAAAVDFIVKTVSPFTVIGHHVRSSQWGGVAATEKQVAYLKKHGLPVELEGKLISKREASRAIDAIIRRLNEGLCTPKQANFLHKRGLDPDVPFSTASQIIDAIQRAGWKTPETIKQRYALQEKAS